MAGLGQRCVSTEGGGHRLLGASQLRQGVLQVPLGCWRTRGWVETITIEEEHTGLSTTFLLPFLFILPRPRGGGTLVPRGGLHPRRVAAREEGWGWDGSGGWRTPRAPPPGSFAASPCYPLLLLSILPILLLVSSSHG